MRSIIVSAVLSLATLAAASTVFAQAPPPPAAAAKTTPAAAPPVATPGFAAPAVSAKATPLAPTAAAVKAEPVNLNTASSADLDTLPQVGPARAKAIIEARTKSRFKDWPDFTARKVVPTNVEAAIRNRVTF